MKNTLTKYRNIPSARRVCIFGNSTTGKTALAGQLVKGGYKLLWLDLESGKDTLLDMEGTLALTDEHLDNIEYIRIPDNAVNTAAVTTLTHMFKGGLPGWICEDHGEWVCARCKGKQAEFFQINLRELTPENNWVIVIDSGTQLSDSAINRILINSLVDLTTAKLDDKTSYAMWLAQGIILDHILGAIQNGNNHVLITAHEIEASGDDKIKKLYPSFGTRNFASKASKYFTNTIHTLKANGSFRIESTSLSSLRADVGGSVNVDLSKDGTSICDFFDASHSGSKVTSIATPNLANYIKK